MLDLGYWILNDVIWHKANPMPNFRGTRFTNATETLIWAKKSADQKGYTFNYHAMKHLNDDKQMLNVWHIPLCTGKERIKIDGKKAHSTQKPEALLYRVLLASTNPGDVVLDPFFGTGTTGAAAKRLNRDYIGIERESAYVEIAQRRLDDIPTGATDAALLNTPSRRQQARVRFGVLVEGGYVGIGDALYSPDRQHCAIIKADGHLIYAGVAGSLHQAAARAKGTQAENGWDYWHYEAEDGTLTPVDALRERYRRDNAIS